MPRKFEELRKKMTPAAQAQAQAKAAAMLKELPLEELRNARRLTQVQLADAMGLGQAAISRLERRTDMYVSTLAHFVEAMGGRLEIRAVFPDGDVRIKQIADL